MILADVQQSDLLQFIQVTGTPGTILLAISGLVVYFRKDIKEWREERRRYTGQPGPWQSGRPIDDKSSLRGR